MREEASALGGEDQKALSLSTMRQGLSKQDIKIDTGPKETNGCKHREKLRQYVKFVIMKPGSITCRETQEAVGQGKPMAAKRG